LIDAQNLGNLDDLVAAAGKILKGDGAVAGAKINADAEMGAHSIGQEMSFGSANTTWITRVQSQRARLPAIAPSLRLAGA
jgi:hypothetical protein